MDRKLLVFSLLMAAVLLMPGRLPAGWVEGGVLLDNSLYGEQNASVLPDGEGGAVVFWERALNEGGYIKHDIYAQRFDIYGNELWTAGGVIVCNAVEDQMYAKAVPDGDGGYIVCWTDTRPWPYADIYAQRLDADGAVQWAANGIIICSAARNQAYNVITTVEGGGAIIAWLDDRNATGWDVYTQRINNSGTALWTADGIAACTDLTFQDDLRIAHSAVNKGAYLVWEDSRNANTDIYGNQIDSLGTASWGTAGKGIITEASYQYNPEIIEDGYGGAIIAWIDMRNGNGDIYAERINLSNCWSVDGLPVCTATGNQNYPIMEKCGQYGTVVAWRDYRGGTHSDVYAQRIDIWGNMLWTANGLGICTYTRDQGVEEIIEDGAGNLIFSWTDVRNVDTDIYIQKVTLAGTIQWETDGRLFLHEYYQRYGVRMAPDGQGGAFMAWLDQRDLQATNTDIYAIRLDGTGYWGYPAPAVTSIEDVPYDQGSQVMIEWDAGQFDIFPYELITHYSVWRSLSGPESAIMLAERDKSVSPERTGPEPRDGSITFRTLGAAMYAWECIKTMDAHRLETYSFAAATLHDSVTTDDGMHYYFVSSNTDDPFVYWDSEPDSGYSVDNLAPGAPLGLAGEQEYTPEGMQLTWDDNEESDLLEYRVYRGTTSGFVPGAGNLIDSPTDSELFDDGWEWEEGYYYKVSAVDVHGNESGYALLEPDGVTGDEPLEIPDATFLAQNFPNPFNPSTTIRFGLKEGGHVSLRIYDTAGRLVAVLIDESRPAGPYATVWNGKDRNGYSAVSGVYFYRLTVGDFLETRKMILLK